MADVRRSADSRRSERAGSAGPPARAGHRDRRPQQASKGRFASNRCAVRPTPGPAGKRRCSLA